MRTKFESLLPLPYEVNSETQRFAEYALQKCVEWYGAPNDLDVPYEFYSYTRTSCSRNSFTKNYIISLAPEDHFEVSKARNWLMIAHEMYHRCTMNRGWLRKYLWVDEALAWQTAFRICYSIPSLSGEHGIDDLWEMLIQQNPVVDFHKMMRLKRRPLIARKYPPGFNVWSFQIGEAMRMVIPWKKFCTIAFQKNLGDWLSLFQVHERDYLKILLKRKEANMGHLVSHDNLEDITDFCAALIVVHEYDLALTLCQELIKRNRVSADLYQNIARIFERKNMVKQSADYHLKAFEAGMIDETSRYILALALVESGQYKEAIPHLEFVLLNGSDTLQTMAAELYHEIQTRNHDQSV